MVDAGIPTDGILLSTTHVGGNSPNAVLPRAFSDIRLQTCDRRMFQSVYVLTVASV